MKRKKSSIFILALLVIAGVLVAGWFFPDLNPMSDRNNWPASFKSNGERIYFTATSSSGQPIVAGGSGMGGGMMGGGMMADRGCVNCHRANRQGGPVMPRFWKTAPRLTPSALFGEHDKDEKDDGHGDHDKYTDETLARAITQGLDPDGKPLDSVMPRWTMSPQDLKDLITYLKTPAG